MISKHDFIDVFDAVKRINDEIALKRNWTEYDKCPLVGLTIIPKSDRISTIGYIGISINYFQHSINIYSSINDDRKYNEEKDKYESWYKYIRRKWKQVREELETVKL